MKRYLARLVGCVLLLTLLSGCAPVIDQPLDSPIVLSDELLALMETVNLEHQAIIKPEVDEAAIVEKWARDTSKYTLDYQIAGSMSDGVLTAQQAKNDVNVLFHSLQTKYGLYEYFGGDNVFELARETILQACDEAGVLTPEGLVDILMANLTFARDGHFFINDQQVALRTFSFHYRDVAFEKTETGYQTLEDKKRVVASVDGYDDLDTLFHRSISNDGAIVYYPVVLMELKAVDFWANDDFALNFTPRDLVVRFKDGSSQLLAAEAHKLGASIERERPAVELHENQSIPVLFSRRMGNLMGGDLDAQTFLVYAEQLKNEPVVIIDLRSNGGGKSDLPYRWLQAYTGEEVTGNGYGVYYDITPIASSTTLHDTRANIQGWRQTDGGFSLWGAQPDKFIATDNLLIVLTGNRTASAAEIMVDLLHNISNVLFIGDNTTGCCLSDSTFSRAVLPHSLIRVQFGKGIYIFPDDDYFQETRGFLPDLWVPAAEAEELAIKLILNNR